MRSFFALALLLAAQLPQSGTQVVSLEAQADASLIESGTGALANGAGPYLFIGRTNQPNESRRRGALRFDLAAALPPGARVEGAKLVLHVSQGSEDPVQLSLHRALRPWSEGSTTSQGGQGGPALPGDLTWLHRSFPNVFWGAAGGDFAAAPSAASNVDLPGYYTFEDPQRLTRDVRRWLREPSSNHGWILIGDEGAVGSSRRIDSRESVQVLQRPLLEIRYRLPR